MDAGFIEFPRVLQHVNPGSS